MAQSDPAHERPLTDASIPWIPAGVLDGDRPEKYQALPPATELAGRSLVLSFEDGRTGTCAFEDEKRLVWTLTSASGEAHVSKTSYLAVRVREQFCFVDFLLPEEPRCCVSLVADLAAGACTLLFGRLPDKEEAATPLLARAAQGRLDLTDVSVTVVSAAVGGPSTANTARHLPSADLEGYRIEFSYSATLAYENIYVNDRFFTWHCLRGAEKGLGDFDRYHLLRLGKDLYFFIWREKIIPTLGVEVFDMAAGKTCGKVFAWQGAEMRNTEQLPHWYVLPGPERHRPGLGTEPSDDRWRC